MHQSSHHVSEHTDPTDCFLPEFRPLHLSDLSFSRLQFSFGGCKRLHSCHYRPNSLFIGSPGQVSLSNHHEYLPHHRYQRSSPKMSSSRKKMVLPGRTCSAAVCNCPGTQGKAVICPNPATPSRDQERSPSRAYLREIGKPRWDTTMFSVTDFVSLRNMLDMINDLTRGRLLTPLINRRLLAQ